MDSQQHEANGQVDIVDDDEVPPQYRVENHRRERDRSVNTPPRRNYRSTHAPQNAAVNESPSLFQVSIGWASPASKKSSLNIKEERKQKGKVEIRHGMQEPHERICHVDQTQVSQPQISELEHEFNNILQSKESEWRVREKDLQRQIHQAHKYAAEKERILQAEIHNIQLEKSALEEEYNVFIRRQQETSFGRMESARWLPADETKIKSDLDRLKRDMRGWAKINSIKDISKLGSFDEA